ncbi:MAG: sigma-70 family RNA polymerase sigma factor [Gammaproteobacteria bacterium]|nr:sigma-70 family RNA polymerase sigma factor [Gammaproteobacteria bacterium]
MEGTDDIDRIERLAALDALEPEQALIDRDLRRAVNELLDQLPERHAKILRMRFGIGVHDDCTQEQIARQQGVTRERIRQIEAQALDALRKLDAAWVLRELCEA